MRAVDIESDPKTFLGMTGSDWRDILIGWGISAVVAVAGSMLARWIW